MYSVSSTALSHVAFSQRRVKAFRCVIELQGITLITDPITSFCNSVYLVFPSRNVEFSPECIWYSFGLQTSLAREEVSQMHFHFYVVQHPKFLNAELRETTFPGHFLSARSLEGAGTRNAATAGAAAQWICVTLNTAADKIWLSNGQLST